MKPPIPYFGGKGVLGPVIASLLPPHGHYVEPYAGSLAVLLAKRPAAHETVNDLDGALMTFWRVLRDRPADMERVCALTPHSRAEHQAAYEPATDELEPMPTEEAARVRADVMAVAYPHPAAMRRVVGPWQPAPRQPGD